MAETTTELDLTDVPEDRRVPYTELHEIVTILLGDTETFAEDKAELLQTAKTGTDLEWGKMVFMLGSSVAYFLDRDAHGNFPEGTSAHEQAQRLQAPHDRLFAYAKDNMEFTLEMMF